MVSHNKVISLTDTIEFTSKIDMNASEQLPTIVFDDAENAVSLEEIVINNQNNIDNNNSFGLIISVLELAEKAIAKNNNLILKVSLNDPKNLFLLMVVLMGKYKFCFSHSYSYIMHSFPEASIERDDLKTLLSLEKMGLFHHGINSTDLLDVSMMPIVMNDELDVALDSKNYPAPQISEPQFKNTSYLQCPACIKSPVLTKILTKESDGVDAGLKKQFKESATTGNVKLLQRDSSRIFSHMGAINERFSFINSVSSNKPVINMLRKFFYGEVSLESMLLVMRSEFPDIDIRLKTFIQRMHLEFHPNDSCNSCCDGCSYGFDVIPKPITARFPFEKISTMLELMAPKAITIVGGGEPTLYNDQMHSLNDVISTIAASDVQLGLISNGTRIIPGDWHKQLSWIRFSIDASTAETYTKLKRTHYFETVFKNFLQILNETDIPSIGFGYVFRSENIAEAPKLIQRVVNEVDESLLSRSNIQFRPWRSYSGVASLEDSVVSSVQIADFARSIIALSLDEKVRSYIIHNTDAKSVIRGGSKATPYFENCFFGMGKSVIRANGDIYPCFVKAATEDHDFLFGNILHDEPQAIALRELFILAARVKTSCVPTPDKCFLAPVNFLVEDAHNNGYKVREGKPDYFF